MINFRHCLILTVATAFLVNGCTSQEPEEENTGPREPKTFYGQTVRQAKDMKDTFVEKDQEVKEQSKLLFEEEVDEESAE